MDSQGSTINFAASLETSALDMSVNLSPGFDTSVRRSASLRSDMSVNLSPGLEENAMEIDSQGSTTHLVASHETSSESPLPELPTRAWTMLLCAPACREQAGCREPALEHALCRGGRLRRVARMSAG